MFIFKFKKLMFCILIVKEVWYFMFYMICVIFFGLDFEGFFEGCDGVNCKLMILESGEICDVFVECLVNGLILSCRIYMVCVYCFEV